MWKIFRIHLITRKFCLINIMLLFQCFKAYKDTKQGNFHNNMNEFPLPYWISFRMKEKYVMRQGRSKIRKLRNKDQKNKGREESDLFNDFKMNHYTYKSPQFF